MSCEAGGPVVFDLRANGEGRGSLVRAGEQLGIKPGDAMELGEPGRRRHRATPGHDDRGQARMVELEREVRELRRSNGMLRSASAFFAAELDRPDV